MDKEEKRRIWKEKFDAWLVELREKSKPKKTKDNPNGVAIGCWLDPNAKIKDNPPRRYV